MLHKCVWSGDSSSRLGDGAKKCKVSSGEDNRNSISGGKVAARASDVFGFIQFFVVCLRTQFDVHILPSKRCVINL